MEPLLFQAMMDGREWQFHPTIPFFCPNSPNHQLLSHQTTYCDFSATSDKDLDSSSFHGWFIMDVKASEKNINRMPWGYMLHTPTWSFSLEPSCIVLLCVVQQFWSSRLSATRVERQVRQRGSSRHSLFEHLHNVQRAILVHRFALVQQIRDSDLNDKQTVRKHAMRYFHNN